MSDSVEQCGHIKNDGEACTYTPKYEDGKCGIHTDNPDGGNGRHTLFNKERASEAIRAACRGTSKAGCARAAGVAKSTLHEWLEGDNTYTYDGEDFSNAFARARSRGEATLINDGLRDPDTDSSMAKFLLSTSFDYVKTEKKEIDQTTEHSGGFEVNINETIRE